MALAEGQLAENTGRYEDAAAHYRRMMALKPGDHRGRLLLADLYRRSGNYEQAITEYRSIITAKPGIGPAYIGASKAYLSDKKLDDAIQVLEDVSSRNASYNEVMMELIGLYNQRALAGKPESLDQASRAISVLLENGVETKGFYQLVADFYYTALKIARASNAIPKVTWPGDAKISNIGDLSAANERAWRDYLERDESADRDEIINDRVMAVRAWSLM
jgi:tetratricopeptide (TPR) repeat protein